MINYKTLYLGIFIVAILSLTLSLGGMIYTGLSIDTQDLENDLKVEQAILDELNDNELVDVVVLKSNEEIRETQDSVLEDEEKECCLFGICWFFYIFCWYIWLLIILIALFIAYYYLDVNKKRKMRKRGMIGYVGEDVGREYGYSKGNFFDETK